MASGSAVLATAAGLPLLGHRRRFGLPGGRRVKENNLFRMWLQTRKVMSTWAMMTLMNMPMG